MGEYEAAMQGRRASCLAIVTDDQFLPGTLVTLSSFLRHNPRFLGTIFVIHAGLSDRSREALEALPGVQLRAVGAPLQARIARIAAGHPALTRKAHHFFALEAFQLRDFERVLLLDSDIVCVGDATEVFTAHGALLACPDQAHFWEQVRDRRSYVPGSQATADAGAAFPMTFNTGVMAISPGLLGQTVFSELLERMDQREWAEVRTGHTISVVLNEHFRDAWTQLPEKYNHLISKGMLHYTRARSSVDDAVFLHFIGRPKPWTGPILPVNEEHRVALHRWWEAQRSLVRSRGTD